MLFRNKREILQQILDREEGFWIIIKPSRHNPSDPDALCVFQNPETYKEATVEIPTAWFQANDLPKIEEAVRNALSRAQPGYRH